MDEESLVIFLKSVGNVDRESFRFRIIMGTYDSVHALGLPSPNVSTPSIKKNFAIEFTNLRGN